jgi:AMP deaminase
VRWLIQIPRLYDIYKASGSVKTFQDIITSAYYAYNPLACFTDTIYSDVFVPLFEVTKDPRTHPELHVFLQRVIGFDTVDDESKTERRIYKKYPYPRVWDTKESPPYSYWLVYLLFFLP